MDSELKLTVLLQGAVAEDQLGFHRGFEKLVREGQLTEYTPYPYGANRSDKDWASYYGRVLRHMRATGSNALLCQFFHSTAIADPRRFLEEVTLLPQIPIIATSCGDPFGPLLASPPQSLTQACSRSDVTFVTSMGALSRKLQRSGAKRITLMPSSACDERFGLEPDWAGPEGQEFDVVFIGSRPGGRNPANHLYWSGRRRTEAVSLLNKRYGRRFGLFGQGWGGLTAWQGPVSFIDQLSTSQRGAVVYGGYPGSLCDYYTSNRVSIQALSGRPIVDHWVPRVDTLLRPGADWILTRDLKEVIGSIDKLLNDPDLAQAVGSSGARAVANRHMDSHRTALMISIMREVYNSRIQGREPRCPSLDYFHAGVDVPSEMRTALRAW